MKYDKEKHCFLIKAFTESFSYEGDTLSTDECPLKKEYCRRNILGANQTTLVCEKFLGTVGDSFHRTFPVKIEDHDFRILCKGSNSIEFITED